MKEHNSKITLEEAYNKAISTDPIEQTIGIQKEKVLHKTMKYFLSFNEANHEIKISKTNKGILYADVKIDNTIYEIQTRSFNALRNKLDEFLINYTVVIVHPIAYHKKLFILNDKYELVNTRKSPKKGNPLEIFKELYKIKNYLSNPNLKIKIVLLDMDEYKVQKEKKHYRSSGYERIVQIPKRLEKIVDLYNKEDFKNLLKEYNLPFEFTSNIFSKCTRLNKKYSIVALNVLTHLEIVKRVSKIKNNYLYQINENT